MHRALLMTPNLVRLDISRYESGDHEIILSSQSEVTENITDTEWNDLVDGSEVRHKFIEQSDGVELLISAAPVIVGRRTVASYIAWFTTEEMAKEERYQIVTLSLVNVSIVFGIMLLLYWLLRSRITNPMVQLAVDLKDIRNLKRPNGLPASEAVEVQIVRSAVDDLRRSLLDREIQLSERNFQLDAANNALLTSQKSLEASLAESQKHNEEKSKFLGHMSHEFRTPLNAILGFSEMLKLRRDLDIASEEYDVYADCILSAGTHLLSMANDILYIATLDAGKVELTWEKLNLYDIVDACISEATISNSGRTCGIVNLISDECSFIFGDEHAIKRIILNLLSNSLKFTPSDGSIEVSAARTNDNFTLSVADTGYGIAKEDLDSITEPFAQASKSPETANEGTGLGLSIVKELATAHGGEIFISSAIGRGTTVQLNFPQRTDLKTTETTLHTVRS